MVTLGVGESGSAPRSAHCLGAMPHLPHATTAASHLQAAGCMHLSGMFHCIDASRICSATGAPPNPGCTYSALRAAHLRSGPSQPRQVEITSVAPRVALPPRFFLSTAPRYDDILALHPPPIDRARPASSFKRRPFQEDARLVASHLLLPRSWPRTHRHTIIHHHHDNLYWCCVCCRKPLPSV